MSILRFLAIMPKAKTSKRRGLAEEGEDFSLGVDGYVSKLNASVHDGAQFADVFNSLKSDKKLLRDDVVCIASRFAFPMAKSTSRKVALERIWRQHMASETAGAKTRSMHGRSAA